LNLNLKKKKSIDGVLVHFRLQKREQQATRLKKIKS